eukprot:TRINITY_DN20023_c0_g1_i1.p1 TRINITY_DN20023_c0_g1~~TRINITY_DN20023_c0_g1_i1.p1  ORF type:complete len:472 (+),score=58.34 TRINITY_DN20023_c0_g1_i1:316-1731(+)
MPRKNEASNQLEWQDITRTAIFHTEKTLGTGMKMTCRHIVDFVKRNFPMVTKGMTEEGWTSSVSRAFYRIHHTTKGRVLPISPAPPDDDDDGPPFEAAIPRIPPPEIVAHPPVVLPILPPQIAAPPMAAPIPPAPMAEHVLPPPPIKSVCTPGQFIELVKIASRLSLGDASPEQMVQKALTLHHKQYAELFEVIFDSSFTMERYTEDEVTLLDFIGRGAFGTVCESSIRGETNSVAKVMDVRMPNIVDMVRHLLQIRMEFEIHDALSMKVGGTIRTLGCVFSGHSAILLLEQGAYNFKQFMELSLGKVDLNVKRAMLQYTLRSLKQIHKACVVHGDLKPENLIVMFGEVIKITDFGLAGKFTMDLTCCEQGTAGYQAPELFTDEAVLGPKADVWAMGVIMWEFFMEEQPFKGMTRNQIKNITMIENGILRALPFSDKCPEEIQNLIRSCWAHRPEDRASAEALWIAHSPSA